MEGGKSLIGIGEWSKPATVLIEKISDAIGGIFKPWQIGRVAQAEAKADRMKALAKIETQIEIAEITQRALGRFLAEETKKQDNMESITSRAIPFLQDDSKPEKVNDDWISNFFDKCRLISDKEMQTIWAKVLAGEANSPGRYSKRTINFLGSLDKSDAVQFTTLCGFSWVIGNICPLVFDVNNDIYKKHGITFNMLKHLDNIGLLSFENLCGYRRTSLPKNIIVAYCYSSTPIIIEFGNEKDNDLDIGKIMLSKIGQELAPICDSKPIPGFLEYTIKHWTDQKLKLFSPYPKPNF